MTNTNKKDQAGRFALLGFSLVFLLNRNIDNVVILNLIHNHQQALIAIHIVIFHIAC